MHSAALATAGDLVFIGQGTGTLDAFDSATGELLWQFNLGAGVHGGPITYEVAGVQYVVAPAGGSFHFGTPAGDELVAFALAEERASMEAYDYPATSYEQRGAATVGQGAVRQIDSDTAADTRPATAPAAVDSAGRRR